MTSKIVTNESKLRTNRQIFHLLLESLYFEHCKFCQSSMYVYFAGLSDCVIGKSINMIMIFVPTDKSTVLYQICQWPVCWVLTQNSSGMPPWALKFSSPRTTKHQPGMNYIFIIRKPILHICLFFLYNLLVCSFSIKRLRYSKVIYQITLKHVK